MAMLAVDEGELGGEARSRGKATAALAEVYDAVGMENAALENFLRAEDFLHHWPVESAQVYLKHAAFRLDREDAASLEASLSLLDKADAYCLRAENEGLGPRVADYRFAILLNRADALSQLGRFAEAKQALTKADPLMRQGSDVLARQAKVRLVAGYLAARRQQPEEAERLFLEAGHDVTKTAEADVSERDYRWRCAREVARAYQAAGQPQRAEDFFRIAIETVEQLRESPEGLELRPWLLSRRNMPHQDLLRLLVELGRHEDALAVAELLHARTWLDAVLARKAADDSAQALAAANLRTRFPAPATRTPSGPDLMTIAGDREALLYVFLGDDLWRAHLRDRAVSFQRLPSDALRAAVAFLSNLDDPAAQALASKILIPPGLSESAAPLYIVANGALANVPFAALLVRDQPLIASRPVSRLPGLSALRCAPSFWGNYAVLLGDSRGDLPEAAHEVTRQAARLGTAAHVGAAATRQVLSSARRAALLHIATHGISTAAGPALMLADGQLTAAEVLKEGLAPRLALLSGCATSVSQAPEAWDGFPSAFLAAGSRHVIATLRSVRDAEAAQVVEAYYAQPAALSPIARLAAAQAQVASSLPVSAWASFAAWGSSECEDEERPKAASTFWFSLFVR